MYQNKVMWSSYFPYKAYVLCKIMLKLFQILKWIWNKYEIKRIT